MRRSSYHDKAERINLIKTGSKQPIQDIYLNTFKITTTARTSDPNLPSSKSPAAYYQPKTLRQQLHRPFTTQKTQSYLDHRSIHFSI